LFAETMFHLYYSPNILDKSSVFVIISNEWRKVNTVNNNQLKQNEKNQQIKVEEQMEKKEEKEPKDKQTKTKKRIKLVLKTILIITALVFSWRFYSLVRFEGRFTPWYVWGISNPYKYWQEHIGLKLIEHGKRYDLKPTIDENDPTTYNVYQNKKHHFRFKYPKGFDLESEESLGYKGQDNYIKFSKKGDYSRESQCWVYILYKGWGVGKNWLPRKRLLVEHYIKKGSTPFYFVTKNGQIAYIINYHANSTEPKNKEVMYVDPLHNSNIIRVSSTCYPDSIQMIDDIISTFEFTP